MGTPRNVCHRCRHKWKTKKNQWGQECPKCGHGNVGPTDPAPSVLPKLIAVGVLGLGGAWYFGLLGGPSVEEVKQELEKAQERIQEEVDAQSGGAPAKSAAPAGSKSESEAAPAAEPEPDGVSASEPAAEPEAAAEPVVEGPNLVTKPGSGGLMGERYLVRGTLRNTGSAAAEGIRVVVVFRDAAEDVLAKVEAEAPERLEPGSKGSYKVALEGDPASRVHSFEAVVESD